MHRLPHVWRQDTTAAAEPRAKCRAEDCGGHSKASWLSTDGGPNRRRPRGGRDTANGAVLAEFKRALIGDEARFEGVRILGVDEHVWRHTGRGEKYVTVIIDLTPSATRHGPARLLDMVEGRSKAAFKTWLAERPQASWRDGVEVVAMDGFTGFKTATAEELPDAVAVMDPFHVVHLAGDALNRWRRVQQQLHGHRGRRDDPLYRARRTLHTGPGLLTDKQTARLTALFAADQHVEVQATWGISQRMIGAYREPDRTQGRALMVKLIESLRTGVPKVLREVLTLRSDPDQARRRRTGLLRPTWHEQRAYGGDQRPPRASARLCTRIPQPRQLHRPVAARDRRLRPRLHPGLG